MRIGILSDLHLGVGDGAERFGHEERAFEVFLDALERWADVIAVNGDLYETWQGAWWGRPDLALAAIRRHRSRLVARLEGGGYALTWGNHDAILAAEGVPGELELCADGVRVVLTHGHRWDPPLKRAPGLGYGFAWGTGWLRRQASRPVFGQLERWRQGAERQHFYNQRPPEALAAPEEASCVYAAGAARWLREQEGAVDVLACGHTHVTARVATPWGLYVNSGSASGGRFDWAAVDTRARWAGAVEDEPEVARGLERLQGCGLAPVAGGVQG